MWSTGFPLVASVCGEVLIVRLKVDTVVSMDPLV